MTPRPATNCELRACHRMDHPMGITQVHLDLALLKSCKKRCSVYIGLDLLYRCEDRGKSALVCAPRIASKKDAKSTRAVFCCIAVRTSASTCSTTVIRGRTHSGVCTSDPIVLTPERTNDRCKVHQSLVLLNCCENWCNAHIGLDLLYCCEHRGKITPVCAPRI